MCFGPYQHQDECGRSGQEENTPAVAPSSAQGSPFQSSRAENRRAVVSARMEESKPWTVQCLPREISHRWQEGRLLGAGPHPLIHQEHLAELLWPKPFHILHMEGPRVHQSPYYVQGSCPCFHNTHKGRESWKVEVMMPTFLPSSWFGCRHDPTGQEKPNHPREFFRECLPFSWRLSSQHLHDATHAWRDCFMCVKIKASLLKQQFLKSFITRKAQCR